MYRLIVVIFLLAGPLGNTQLLASVTDTIPCDETVQVQKTFCLNCETWSDLFSPDFTGKLPVEYSMTICDSDGLEVYATNSLEKGWDGIIKNTDQKLSVFKWAISYRYEKDGTLFTCTGTVAVIQ